MTTRAVRPRLADSLRTAHDNEKPLSIVLWGFSHRASHRVWDSR